MVFADVLYILSGVISTLMILVGSRRYKYGFNVGQLVLYKGELMVVQSLRRDGRRKVYDLRRP